MMDACSAGQFICIKTPYKNPPQMELGKLEGEHPIVQGVSKGKA